MRVIPEGLSGWYGPRWIALTLLLVAVLMGGASIAQDRMKGDLTKGGPTASAPGAEVYFVNLKDGATVGTTFSVNFGLQRMGLAPAGSERKDSGHHHLLIDAELPALDRPIPNDFNHLHFGAGQSETELTLKPGDHTLQLLLGDKDHVPHTPPVMSARITIHVVDGPPPPAPTARTPSPPGAEVYFVDLADGAVVQPKFRVHFGLRNMGVAPAGSDRENSGHHHLLIDAELPSLDQPIPNDFNHLHFGSGQTEADLSLPPGEHTLQLLLGDGDHLPHDPPVMSARIRIRVAGGPAAPVAEAPTPTPPATPAPGPAPTPDSVPEPPGPTAAPAPDRRPTPSAKGAEVYFVDLKDGASVPAKFNVYFAARNMAIASAGGANQPNSGHYHLLIDTELPPLDRPIPNDASHLHFDRGETQTTLTLAPGRHTLQLVLGDKDHIPHSPPVVSQRIVVNVGGGGTADRKPSPARARAYFIGLRNGDEIPATVTLRFGLVNMEVTRAGVMNQNGGHYHLLIDTGLPPMDAPIPNDASHIDLAAGQTQAKITLTPGEHTLQLLLGDENHMPHDPPVISRPMRVVVVVDRRTRDDRNRDEPPRSDRNRNDHRQYDPDSNGRRRNNWDGDRRRNDRGPSYRNRYDRDGNGRNEKERYRE